MDDEKKARLAIAAALPGDQAVSYALLRLAAQVQRVADTLDQLTGDGPTSTSLNVVDASR